MKAEHISVALDQALGVAAINEHMLVEMQKTSGMSRNKVEQLIGLISALGLDKCDLADLLVFLLNLIPTKSVIYRTARSLVRGAVGAFKDLQGCGQTDTEVEV